MPEPLNNALPIPTDPIVEDKKIDPPAPAATPETQKILDTLKGIGEQVQGLSDRVDNFEIPVVKDSKLEEKPPAKWQHNSWDDFPNLAAEKAKEVVEQTFAEREKAVKDTEDARKQELGNIDKEIDVKVGALETQGKIPAIKNADDPNDLGRGFRKQLYGLASKMETLNLEMVAETINQMNSQGFQYDFKANKWLRANPVNPGQNAPVGSSNFGGSGTEGPTYETIHKARSLSELARRAGM